MPSSPRRRRVACRSSPPGRCSTWLDGRNGSSFAALTWNGTTLGFTINVGIGAKRPGLQAMVPAQSGGKTLTSLTRNGTSVSFTLSTLKGVQWATFAANPGAYQATYQ